MRLDSESFAALHAALSDGFVDYDDVATMARLCWRPLAEITNETRKPTVIRRLIEDCETRDAVEALIGCVQRRYPDNTAIAALRFQDLTAEAGEPPSQDPAPVDATRLRSIPVGAFVGRGHALTALRRLIRDETKRASQRPIALVGMGGVGKTSLARALLRDLAEDYPGGEPLVLERPLKPFRQVFSEWAKAMGLSEEGEYTAADMRGHLGAFHDGGPRICLVDDVATRDVKNLTEINDALPVGWPRLVTTRDEQVVTALGAVRYPVRPMTDDDAMKLIEERLHTKFDRASSDGAAGVDRAIVEHADALAEFKERVQRLPLALHLGIGTCNSLKEIPEVVTRLVTSLEGGVDEFEAGAWEASNGNDSLAASLSISLHDLTYDSRRNNVDWDDRFRALGVLPDGSRYDADFLLAVWGDPPGSAAGRKTLHALVWASLLEQDVDSADYTVHPVVRAFAAGALAENGALLETARRRYHRVVIDRARRTYTDAPELWLVDDDLYPHLERVLPAVTAGLAQSEEPADRASDHVMLEIGRLAAPDVSDRAPFVRLNGQAADDVMEGFDLAEAFKRAVRRRPWGTTGTHVLKLGLICARALEDDLAEVEYLSRLGAQHTARDPERAETYFAAATRLARDHRSPKLGRILTEYAECRRAVADSETAIVLATEALEIHLRDGDERMAALTHIKLGDVFWRLDRHDESEHEYSKARAYFERIDDRHCLAELLNRLASVEFNRGGRYEQAIVLFEQALEQHEALNDRAMKAEDLNDLGACHRYLGHYETAESYFRQALELNAEVGNRRLQAINICNLAGALYAQGQYDLAQQRAEEGQTLGKDVDAKVPELWGLIWEGLAWQGMAEFTTAERILRQAVELGRSFDSPRDLAGGLARLGLLLGDELGQSDEAAALIDEAIGLLERRGTRVAFTNVTLAELKARQEHLAEARAP